MITHILYVQPIFAPDQKRADRNINSIDSIGTYLKNNGADGISITIMLGGWAKTDELWNQIVAACRRSISPTYTPQRFDRNWGKSVVVNKLVSFAKQSNTIYQAMLTADSDILYPLDNRNMFGRLAFSAIQLENYKRRPFGMIALNQVGEGCHFASCQENKVEFTVNTKSGQMVERIVWPSNPSGIAGGCLFLSRKMWETVGGYRVMGLYAGEDAWLLVDCYTRGFSYQMMDSLPIYHPPENDQEWAQFKVKVCQRDSVTGPKSDITPIIAEMDDFWNNKKS